MKIQHPLLIKAVGVAGSFLVRRLGETIDYHFRYEDPLVDPEVARRLGHRYIYAFFHEVMLFPAHYWAWPTMHILISDHRDGELITQVVKRLGFGVVRGSTTRGGARALREMTTKIEHDNLCVTPDGPRGPRRHVHQGLVYLASRTGLPVIGAGMAFKDPWRARSWDRFAVPRPFSKAACVAPAAVVVPPDADRDALESCRLEVETRMNRAMDEAERWVETL
ncbi:lysophospholipid acyltransferase family protein [Aquisphaera insulae]|uniref:lysophospholipid acyltransferase family protein n=1 Tax=Aquisphaera insulae TaxID=2712864 RepID=UPI0013EE0504|nr:lysophospholipid acyltransferase family protein [Aquisphaera insulae]